MKNWKWYMTVAILVLCLTVLSACSGSQNSGSAASGETGGGSGSSDDQITIGVSYQNLQNEFIINIQDALQAKAKELGIKLIETDGQGKAENQISQIENFITQKVDAIILNPFDKNGSAPAVDKAVAANIPIIVLNAQVANMDKVTTYVGSDDHEAGKIEMQYIADLLGGKGNIVILHGPNGHSAEVARTEGNKEVLAKYPDIKILAEQTANWDRAQALSLMENWIQSDMHIDAVVAQNDEMALGAYKAVEAAKLQDKIKIIGIDAIPDALKAVEEGKLVATVYQDARGQGEKAVEMAVKAAKGEPTEKTVYIPFQLVTKDNLNQFK
ncbi:sugar ABC transporter substrate-binding protein [Cohnella thermotolerans]|uniref:sugar ABC transporter substrate-binding protein n=1 Tax=Cohnella thermotolerans TaxID=329858 RepID=UPI0004265125|nr:sugar ABC transporter substrate-binding protein [Cohnella thermotolerans]